MAAPIGTERPNVRKAGTRPTAAPMTPPEARPAAAPPVPSAAAPPTAEAAATCVRGFATTSRTPCPSSVTFEQLDPTVSQTCAFAEDAKHFAAKTVDDIIFRWRKRSNAETCSAASAACATLSILCTRSSKLSAVLLRLIGARGLCTSTAPAASLSCSRCADVDFASGAAAADCDASPSTSALLPSLPAFVSAVASCRSTSRPKSKRRNCHGSNITAGWVNTACRNLGFMPINISCFCASSNSMHNRTVTRTTWHAAMAT
mmetsp:Transcript_15106/g.43653  ORF Transcript_15106/g.43653 Transcript_15106/m.43653 type:complete len:260 (-) Transcript_15106:365-1144(-)